MPKGRGFVSDLKGVLKQALNPVLLVFSRPYLKKIPLDLAATQYLGFTPIDPYESPPNSLNPKYWVAAS